ncbi:MAG: hypothetical protein STHCBS139747_005445 [Sporothrix thermara]
MPPRISSARPGAGRGTAGSSSSGFRGTGAFKPPRPVAAGTRAATAPTRATAAAKSSARGRPSVGIDISDDEDDSTGGDEGDNNGNNIDNDDDDRDELERSRINSAQRRRRTIDQFQEDEGQDNDDAGGAATDVATDNEDDNHDNRNHDNYDNDDDDDDDDDKGTSGASKSLPPALLARVLHHFFQNPGGKPTRLTQDAHDSINKYMEIFIREAVARSVAERGTGTFLDVDVLQKVAGQLIMDM